MHKFVAGMYAPLVLVILVATGIRSGGAEPERDWAALREETFDTIWQTVADSYYDPAFGGIDWRAVGEKYRARLPEAADNEALRPLLQAMLGELRQTHFAILPRETAPFTPEERARMGTAGAEVTSAGEMVVICHVSPGSAAAEAGVREGDVVLQIDELVPPILMHRLKEAGIAPARRNFYAASWVNQRLHGNVGAKTTLVLRAPDTGIRNVELTYGEYRGIWSEPMGSFPSTPVEVRAQCGADGVGYLRFNVFARAAMKDIRALLKSMPSDGALVIDLRGNPGGIGIMSSGISGWLSAAPFTLGTMHLRSGHMGFTVSPQAGAFLGPVAVLIDSGSASTSEIMAAGLQEAGRVRVFGEPSPGAALPSLMKTLPTGDLLQHAIADMQTPKGKTIEGVGVIPDEVVYRGIEDLAMGRDPVREAAERWLQSQRHKTVAAAPLAP